MLRFVCLAVPLWGATAFATPPEGDSPSDPPSESPGEPEDAAPVFQKFVTPIGGTPFEDWAIVNYVDVDPAFRGVKDARGGPYAYDGHEGVDFTLPNFVAMDRGVPALAAADGVVLQVRDGHPDRYSGDVNDPETRPTTPPNLVRIEHPGGLRTSYLHLKKDSVTVKPGERVTAGQTIGLVGSSGVSSGPHLHFELHSREGAHPQQIARRGGRVVATLRDPKRWWKSPLPYAGDVFGVLDHGVTTSEPTEEIIMQRPADAGAFVARGPVGGADRTVWVWAQLHGFAEGDRLDYQFYDPRGRTWSTISSETPAIRFGWWTANVELPARALTGRWTVRVKRNDEPLFTESFLVRSERR